jgi:hypothetical protein
MPTPPGKKTGITNYIAYSIFVLNTLLYPYSRFVYESIMRFILGDNILVSGLGLMMIVKYLTMGICWAAAILIAPFGLAYLYFYHSKSS